MQDDRDLRQILEYYRQNAEAHCRELFAEGGGDIVLLGDKCVGDPYGSPLVPGDGAAVVEDYFYRPRPTAHGPLSAASAAVREVAEDDEALAGVAAAHALVTRRQAEQAIRTRTGGEGVGLGLGSVFGHVQQQELPAPDSAESASQQNEGKTESAAVSTQPARRPAREPLGAGWLADAVGRETPGLAPAARDLPPAQPSYEELQRENERLRALVAAANLSQGPRADDKAGTALATAPGADAGAECGGGRDTSQASVASATTSTAVKAPPPSASGNDGQGGGSGGTGKSSGSGGGGGGGGGSGGTGNSSGGGGSGGGGGGARGGGGQQSGLAGGAVSAQAKALLAWAPANASVTDGSLPKPAPACKVVCGVREGGRTGLFGGGGGAAAAAGGGGGLFAIGRGCGGRARARARGGRGRQVALANVFSKP